MNNEPDPRGEDAEAVRCQRRYSRPYNMLDETGFYFDVTPQVLEAWFRTGSEIHVRITEGIPDEFHIVGVKALALLDPNIQEGECGQFIRFFLGRKDGAPTERQGPIHITATMTNGASNPS